MPAKAPRIPLPEVLTTPTGHLLPAGILYSRSAIDTAGGVSSDFRVGLGDVAEFGVATLDSVRFRADSEDPSERVRGFVTATFRMGVVENQLFKHQPGLALGFRKSFLRELGEHKFRTAELTLVASKRLGSRAAIHLGGAFWDASLTSPFAPTVSLHQRRLSHQLRGFAGAEASPFDKSQVLIDFNWEPEFCPACTDPISLRAVLSWGVRYHVQSWLSLESGVRIPDILDANLLDAQIFGQLTVVSRRLRDAVDRLK